MKLKVIIERNEGDLWGRIEGIGNFGPVTVSSSKKEVVDNLVMLIEDYLQHEGKNDAAWNKFDAGKAEFEFVYDVQAFFIEYSFLKQTKIAELSGLNPGLLRQYASGVKHPSAAQAMKIEKAIHHLAQELQTVAIYAD